MLLDPTICISLDVAVFLSLCLSVSSQLRYFACSILGRIETALGNIKEGLVVDLDILVNFSVLNRSALLNFLGLSDKTFSCLCLVYLSCLFCQNSSGMLG